MRFPLDLEFRLISFSRQVAVRDAGGTLLFHVKQKSFKLKEDIVVFADEAQTHELYRIRADRVLDFSATYTITDALGHAVGAVSRQGMRSLWRARYAVTSAAGVPTFAIAEENPWVKVVDELFSQLPVVGLLSGYVFHPAYRVTRGADASEGDAVLRVVKQPAFFGGRFTIEANAQPTDEEARLAVLSVIMMVLLERRRG